MFPFMVVYTCKKCGEPNFLTPHEFWNTTDFHVHIYNPCVYCEELFQLIDPEWFRAGGAMRKTHYRNPQTGEIAATENRAEGL
jgi:hypothetical protein